MRTAAIYARYSSDSQSEQSIEGQVRVCKQFAEKNDILIIDEYIDRATTGTNDNRASFQQMLKDSKKKQWSVILVYKLDRFARNKYESVVNRKKLTDNGVELISAMENIPDTPEGKLFLAVIEGFNEYFSEDLKQKVNRGLKESWLKGNATGGNHIFGYDIKDKKYVINEYEADIIRKVFTMYSNGYKVVTIAEELKKDNAHRLNGKHLNARYLYDILHNKRYTGVVTHQGVEYTNIFPPIITEKLWRAVDMINEENKIAPSRKKEIYDYILSGKLICGHCKRRMSGESGTGRNGIHYYYVCNSKRKKRAECSTTSVKKDYIENLVIDTTMTILKNNHTITELAKCIYNKHEKLIKDNSKLQMLEIKKKEIVKTADNLVKAIEQGIITDFTKDRLTELQEQLYTIDIEINKEKHNNYSSLTVEEIEKYLLSKVFEDTDDIKTRKIIVNTFIREIIWYGDKITITYNFQNDNMPTKISKENVEEIEKQVEDNSQPVSFIPNGSCKFLCSAPRKSLGIS